MCFNLFSLERLIIIFYLFLYLFLFPSFLQTQAFILKVCGYDAFSPLCS